MESALRSEELDVYWVYLKLVFKAAALKSTGKQGAPPVFFNP
jgi:hypothetical protein